MYDNLYYMLPRKIKAIYRRCCTDLRWRGRLGRFCRFAEENRVGAAYAIRD